MSDISFNRFAADVPGNIPPMPLTRKERRALQELERQLAEDPQIDTAFSTLPKSPRPRRFGIPLVVGWALVVVGAVATIGFLTVSFLLSFIGFLVMFGGMTVVASSVVDTVRSMVTGASAPRESDQIR